MEVLGAIQWRVCFKFCTQRPATFGHFFCRVQMKSSVGTARFDDAIRGRYIFLFPHVETRTARGCFSKLRLQSSLVGGGYSARYFGEHVSSSVYRDFLFFRIFF